MSSAPKIWLRMGARSIHEPHRAASELELLFDLTFVVAVGALTGQFEQAAAHGHAGEAVVPCLQVFFAIWWAWMNFTWFASSYVVDDVVYRLLTMVQMGGVLVLAAGVPAAVNHTNYRTVLLGYVVMRAGLVTLWLRASIEDPAGRRTALRYAWGISVLQLAWLIRFVVFGNRALPGYSGVVTFAGLALLELAVPRWAERAGPTSWHPHHIAERYGLFTIILLGDSIFAASTGVRNALAVAGVSGSLIGVAAASLILLCALWWLYFLQPAGEGLTGRRQHSYWWGYGHYILFASLAALGSGLRLAIEQTARLGDMSPVVTGYTVAVPTGVFVLLLWAVYRPLVGDPVLRPGPIVAGAAAILVAPLAVKQVGLALGIAAVAVVPVALIAGTLRRQRRLGP